MLVGVVFCEGFSSASVESIDVDLLGVCVALSGNSSTAECSLLILLLGVFGDGGEVFGAQKRVILQFAVVIEKIL